MEIFNRNRLFAFMEQKNLFVSISLLFILASFILIFIKGLNYGIDFAGGTVVQVKYTQPAPIPQIREIVKKDSLFENAQITKFGSDEEIVIRFKTSSQNVGDDIGDRVSKILKNTGEFEVRKVDMVGPKVGSELREKGILSIVLSIIAILIYISFRFEWRFAVASVLALVHDISISIGAVVLFNIEVNLEILAALLTILGYSLNDTIIVFDRIRESVNETKNISLVDLINKSISKTLSRTTLTSLTVFFVVLTLFLFGGEIIYGFSLTLLVGVIVGTYSSIFIAAPILIWFGFDVEKYRYKQAEKEKIAKEKEKIRAMYEQGTI